ncbi:flagellar motor switch protein FliM [Salinisphaera sp. Q1T1-3]|uniref:flagellar motor switch protein FliM n=1 Tax=Salinisphaera sp. Q1T1-3 TaxID=2321229 RepID=UPI000E7419B5|nr:flagellar motor switch protein FliM [Salinisphaera sp. Q1T1-3]RJS95157.1 flagellar motor switch protein FliM [Salinisphaera sp. Q1T1-3]
MADDDMLSQAEIDSLLKGVSGDDEPVAEEKTATGKRIRAFDPATQQRVVRGRLHTLDIINERFARDFRMSLFNLIRRNADITVDSVRIQPYSEFTRNLPVPANINLFSMKPLRGNALMVFPPNMVFLVVDSLFGGDGRFLTRSEGREFTHTEQRIISRLLKLAMDSYDQGWRSVYPLELEFQRAEMQVRFANITTSPKELVVNTTFHLEVGSFGADFNICIPYAMIEPIREVLSNTALQKADPDEQNARARRLAGEVERSHVPLNAEFTTVESTIGELSRLAVGDVLPIDLPDHVTARVDGVSVFKAVFGRLNGRKALRVAQMIDHASTPTSQDHQP